MILRGHPSPSKTAQKTLENLDAFTRAFRLHTTKQRGKSHMEVQEAVGAAIANEDKIIYKDSTYELVSKVAYLIGVPRHIFENEHEAPQMEVFERLEADKAARIIRHLSIIRTAH